MNNKNNKSDNDWDQFVIIDEEINIIHDKVNIFNKISKNICIQDTIKEELNENLNENKIMKVSSSFCINNTLNKSNCYSYLDLLLYRSSSIIKKILFSICYLSIKYIYTI